MNNQNIWIIPYQEDMVDLSSERIDITDLGYPDSRKIAYRDVPKNIDSEKFREVIRDRIGQLFVVKGRDMKYAVMFSNEDFGPCVEMSQASMMIQDIFRVLISKSLGTLNDTGYLSSIEINRYMGTNAEKVLKFLDIINNGTLSKYNGNEGQILMAGELGGMNLDKLYILASRFGKIEELGWTNMCVPYADVVRFKKKLELGLEKYKGNRGQILMAKELGKMNLRHLFALASGLGKIEELGWTNMCVPYADVVRFKKKLELGLEKYKGNKGQILMAKELGKMNLSHLYALASGLGKIEELGWTYICVPYEMVAKFNKLLEDDNEGIYKGNDGQILMAEKLGKIHLGQLYSLASGLHKAKELGWTQMGVPYEEALRFKKRLEVDVEKYKGNAGQILMAGELGGMHLEQLYRLASGLGRVKELGWTWMSLPYADLGRFENIILGLIQTGEVVQYTGLKGKFKFAFKYEFRLSCLIPVMEVFDFQNILNWRQISKKGFRTVKSDVSMDSGGFENMGLHEVLASQETEIIQEDLFLERQIVLFLQTIVDRAGQNCNREIDAILGILDIPPYDERYSEVSKRITHEPQRYLDLYLQA